MDAETLAHIEKLEADIRARDEEAAALRKDAAEATELATTARKALETATAEKRMLETQANRTDMAKAEVESQVRQDAAVAELVGLIEVGRKVFATAKDPFGQKWKADGKKAGDIRREIIKHLEPDFALTNADGSAISDETISALCRQAIAVKTRVDSANTSMMAAAAGARITSDARRAAGGDDDEDDEPMADAEKARKDMIKRMKDKWTPPGKKDRRNSRDAQGAGR